MEQRIEIKIIRTREEEIELNNSIIKNSLKRIEANNNEIKELEARIDKLKLFNE